MISVSKGVPVSPPEVDPRLTREDVWRGLDTKANDALPFVPVMTFCEVQSRWDNVIEREVEIRGQRFGERVTLNEPDGVMFERTWGSVLGTIRNEIPDDDAGELDLRFSFDLELEGVKAGYAEESEFEQTMMGNYLKAVDSTLAAVRRWVREGTPA